MRGITINLVFKSEYFHISLKYLIIFYIIIFNLLYIINLLYSYFYLIYSI